MIAEPNAPPPTNHIAPAITETQAIAGIKANTLKRGPIIAPTSVPESASIIANITIAKRPPTGKVPPEKLTKCLSCAAALHKTRRLNHAAQLDCHESLNKALCYVTAARPGRSGEEVMSW